MEEKKTRAIDNLNDTQRGEMDEMAKDYLEFQKESKTVWETGRETVRRLEAAGFRSIEDLGEEVKDGTSYEELVGQKVYIASEDFRNVAGIVIGEEGLEQGMNLAYAHMDKPELHVKRAEGGIFDTGGDGVFLDTQYYGGIKKHQWFARPLELRGEVSKDGKLHHFTIDLATVPEKLPHLDKQSGQKVGDAFPGEKLDVFTGYFKEADFLAAVSEKAGIEITKKDLVNSYLTVVPRGDPYRVGEALVGQHDDTICSYTQTEAITRIGTPKHTAIVIGFDKEEIGSNGKTGGQGAFFDYVVDKVTGVVKGAEVTEKLKAKEFGDVYKEEQFLRDAGAFKREVLYASKALSADVNAAYNPIFPENFDPRNSAHLGEGVTVTPYTGSGGKYSTSEAPIGATEELGAINARNSIPYQPGLLGKVDGGGGGTIAKFIAQKGVDTIDTGPALWSMHSPASEIAHVVDLYSCEQEIEAYLES